MSMLSRYQKSGGFVQLLQLIETCGKNKQENFLTIIEGEDVRWAHAIREKMLTIEKILKWPDEILAEVAARLQALTLATFLHGIKTEDRDRVLKTFTHTQKRNVDDLFASKTPAPSEISSAFLKVLQEVRYMMTHSYIRADKFASEMVIGEDIEDKLGKSVGIHFPSMHQLANSTSAPSPNSHAAASTSHTSHGHHEQATTKNTGASNEDVIHLQKQVHSLALENELLKSELRGIKDKLAQIKKIA